MDLILGQSKLGKAIFANKDFKKGEEIIEFKGKLFTYEQLPTPYDEVEDHYTKQIEGVESIVPYKGSLKNIIERNFQGRDTCSLRFSFFYSF